MYTVFPPYIDAYRTEVTPDNVKEVMKNFAQDWGEQSVGRAILQGKAAAEYHGKLVVACATDRDNILSDLLLLFTPGADFDKAEIVEGWVNYEWDAT